MSIARFLLCGAIALALGQPSCHRKVKVAETPRPPRQIAGQAIRAAVDAFRAADPDASFTFFDGHIDSFATTAKPTVPDYAVAILQGLGLSIAAHTPLKLGGVLDRLPQRDRDADASTLLPYVKEVGEATPVVQANADAVDPVGATRPRVEDRTRPAPDAAQLLDWNRPDARVSALEQRAATPILRAFLDRHRNVFEAAGDQVERVLRPVGFQTGALVRRAVFEQSYGEGEKLLYGKTVVQFDENWNVVGISRMIVTPAKLAISSGRESAGAQIDEAAALRIAAGTFAPEECRSVQVIRRRAERAVDPVRRLRVWDVEQASADGNCHWRTLVDGATGRVLNVSDLVDRAFNDAKVNRWSFPGGDLFNPVQSVSTGFYTRDDRRLEHDFFYMMNDHRCEGDPEQRCGNTGFATTWCARAHGTTSGSSSIRATRRPDRDFSSYFPGGSSETFAETNAYYWARWFAQWLKPALDVLGVLPRSANDYPRVLIITDNCATRSVHSASYDVTTDGDRGEGIPVIRLAHRNPAGTSSNNAACEGGGCFDNPSNIHHEMNHFFLSRYFGVGSDIDCGGANQLKFLHEGALGTAVPQAYWHNYYGVGYNPSSANRLYFSDGQVGRVHADEASRMSIGGYLCANNTDQPYHAGRVVGQALWEFYHGLKVDGSRTSGTWRPSTDRDFNHIVYWAADLTAGSSYKDRYEFANRLMEILDKHTNWSREGKRDYCAIFEHHGLRNYINPDYCD